MSGADGFLTRHRIVLGARSAREGCEEDACSSASYGTTPDSVLRWEGTAGPCCFDTCTATGPLQVLSGAARVLKRYQVVQEYPAVWCLFLQQCQPWDSAQRGAHASDVLPSCGFACW